MNEKIGLDFSLVLLFLDSNFPARYERVSLCFARCFAFDTTIDGAEHIGAVPWAPKRNSKRLQAPD
jgi:hypothetical protein